VVEKQPTAARVFLQLAAKADNLEAALKAIEEKQATAKEVLAALGAEPESISSGTPRRSETANAQREQFQQMIRQRMRLQGRELPESLTPPEVVTVACTLTADWPIDADEDTNLLVWAEKLSKKIEDAELNGGEEEESEDVPPEVAEMMAEMGGMMAGAEEQPDTDKPLIVFVAQLTDEERREGMAAAYKDAQKQAEMTAAAANVKLGKLLGLNGTSHFTSAGNMDMVDYSYGSRAYAQQQYFQQLMQQAVQGNRLTQRMETLSSDPDSLQFVIAVAALFEIVQ